MPVRQHLYQGFVAAYYEFFDYSRKPYVGHWVWSGARDPVSGNAVLSSPLSNWCAN